MLFYPLVVLKAPNLKELWLFKHSVIYSWGAWGGEAFRGGIPQNRGGGV